MSLTNTQWVQAKTPADIMLEGVNVELDWTDTCINSIIVRDANGNALRIIRGEYSGMKAMVPATVEKYRLHGVCCGIDIDQTFEKEHEAEDRQREIERVERQGANRDRKGQGACMIDIDLRKRVMQRARELGHCVCSRKEICPCSTLREKNICMCAGEVEESIQTIDEELSHVQSAT